jgi:glycosyltransferase involved in cell wall biosynthesis
MKIVQISPGTGNFYCGVCIRDNAMVSALREVGHDTLMIPLYLPFVTDEKDTSEGAPILFGGINVYLQQKSALFRHTPRFIDRWFDSRSLLAWSAKHAGMTSAKDLGEITVSSLKGEEGKQAKEIGHLVDWLEDHGKPDVVILATCLLAGLARKLKQRLGVPVVCTLQGEDGFLDSMPPPYRERCWNLVAERCAEMDALIPVSHYYGDLMRERLNLPVELFRVVQNGISLEGYSRSSLPMDPPVMGYLARFCYDKGLHRAADAFIELKKRDSLATLRFHAIGTSTASDEHYIAGVEETLKRAGVWKDCRLETNVSREDKLEFLKSITVLSVPAIYGESFGLYLLEAMAAGVPVVQPASGAFPELLEATGGGILTPDAEASSLADGIEKVVGCRDRLTALSDSAYRSVRTHFTVQRMAREVAEILEDVIAKRSSADNSISSQRVMG